MPTTTTPLLTIRDLTLLNCQKDLALMHQILARYNTHAALVAALEGMLNAYAPDHDKTARTEGEWMLVSYVRAAREALAQERSAP